MRAPEFALYSEERLSKVDLAEQSLPRLHATDVEFDECNLANVEAPEATFLRVRLAQCKLSGASFAKDAGGA
jgi:uncharacterized protein YjbI with pentapeptide repeats